MMTSLAGIGKVKEVFYIIGFALVVNITLSIILLTTIGVPGAAIAFVTGAAIQAVLSFRIMRSHIGFDSSKLLSRGFRDVTTFIRSKLYGIEQP